MGYREKRFFTHLKPKQSLELGSPETGQTSSRFKTSKTRQSILHGWKKLSSAEMDLALSMILRIPTVCFFFSNAAKHATDENCRARESGPIAHTCSIVRARPAQDLSRSELVSRFLTLTVHD